MTDAPERRLHELLQLRVRVEQQIADVEAEIARAAANAARARIEADKKFRAAQRERRLAQTQELEELIVLLVAFEFDIDPADLFAENRTRNYVNARTVAYLVARAHEWTYTRIGKWAGRDHTSVLNALRDPKPELLHIAHEITKALTRQAAA